MIGTDPKAPLAAFRRPKKQFHTARSSEHPLRRTPVTHPLLVWRDSEYVTNKEHDFQDFENFYRFDDTCPFCLVPLGWKYHHGMGVGIPSTATVKECAVCAYHFRVEHVPHSAMRDMMREMGVAYSSYRVPILRQFDIDSGEVALSELGAHLRKRKSDIYGLHPRRFEELVEDVFKNLGYRTRLTKATRDGGRDIELYDAGNKQVMVEVKRYAANRKVGVSIVRQVRGVKFIAPEFSKAIIVTTSSFTKDAIREAADNRLRDFIEFDIELMDSDNLLRAMEVYNGGTPTVLIDRLRDLSAGMPRRTPLPRSIVPHPFDDLGE